MTHYPCLCKKITITISTRTNLWSLTMHKMCGDFFSILIIILTLTINCDCLGMIRTDPIVYDDNSVISHLIFFCHVLPILFELGNDVLKHEKSQNSAPYNCIYGSLFYTDFIVVAPFTLLLSYILICVICWKDKILCLMIFIIPLSTNVISY